MRSHARPCTYVISSPFDVCICQAFTLTQVARVAAECRVTVPQDTPTRSESQDADGENHDDEGENNDENPDRDDDNAAAAQEGNENEDHDEDREEESVDTTGDSDSSRGARGNGRMISFGLVDDIFELRGAFDYRKATIPSCVIIYSTFLG